MSTGSDGPVASPGHLGPSWLGIGAQRCGTTWFCELLLQHPRMNLASSGHKELHELYREDLNLDGYRALFDAANAGEWTPFYLRAPWVPQVANQVLSPEGPLIVLLRDPVERFESAMRHWAQRGKFSKFRKNERSRFMASDATWAGMYADQLDHWCATFPPRRLLVFQYERVRDDPQTATERVWGALGLDPVTLTETWRPSPTTTDPDRWKLPTGLRGELTTLYGPQVERLEHDWGMVSSLWPNFA